MEEALGYLLEAILYVFLELASWRVQLGCLATILFIGILGYFLLR